MSDSNPSVTAIVGESGSGKTTLVRLMLGLIHPTEGEVFYRGKDLRTLSRPERRTFQREVQTIFQDPFEVYNPFYKVDHVLEMPIANFGMASSQPRAAQADGRGPQRGRASPGGDTGPLSAPTLRRSAAADHGRPRADVAAPDHHC